MKRKIAALKGQGGSKDDLIKELTAFLDICMQDSESWKELADIYLSRQM